ncbi:MAG: TRAP transporter large permease [Chloroflexi bacterium]|nr:TRAP transporter large permease [Chloroflexota bacterium]MBM4453562.1 TRAP transporter large permease [Chloroflexota bacterium]
MNPTAVGIAGIVVLVFIFLLRMPVGFAMAFVGLLGFSYLVSVGAGLDVLARDYFYVFSSYSLTVIPMFVFMGCIASGAGMSKRLYDAGYLMLGRLRGGLAMATIAGCAGFAAICGSTNACAAAMGRVSLPEMKRYNYDDTLATGTVAAAGSLGILIPPSTIFLVYGIMTEQSIGKLFIAGVFPGLILAGLFVATVTIVCSRNPSLAPAGATASWRDKLDGISGMGEMLVLFLLVITGLFLGWFSPTQAGGAGAAGALLIGLIRRQLAWDGFLTAVKDTLRITCMIMVIVAGATVFGHFMAVSKIPLILADWVSALPLPPMAVMAVIVFIYLIGGCFMDSLAMITLTIPIFYPAIIALGFDPIWFGVIIVLIVEMGVITPPVGINVYVIKGIARDVPIAKIFKGVLPFLIAELIMVGILIAFPKVATFLPSLITY